MILCQVIYIFFSESKGIQFLSLQRVKENLRRLRWQQERVGEGHSSVHVKKNSFAGEIATNVCKFVSGETVKGGSSGASDHEGSVHVVTTDPKEMAIALENQQSRAEVSYCNSYIFILTYSYYSVNKYIENNSQECSFLYGLYIPTHYAFGALSFIYVCTYSQTCL